MNATDLCPGLHVCADEGLRKGEEHADSCALRGQVSRWRRQSAARAVNTSHAMLPSCSIPLHAQHPSKQAMATEMARPPAGAVECYPPPERVQNGAAVASMEQYREMYESSMRDPEVRGLPERWKTKGHSWQDEGPRNRPKPATWSCAGLLGQADGAFPLAQEVGQRR